MLVFMYPFFLVAVCQIMVKEVVNFYKSNKPLSFFLFPHYLLMLKCIHLSLISFCPKFYLQIKIKHCQQVAVNQRVPPVYGALWDRKWANDGIWSLTNMSCSCV